MEDSGTYILAEERTGYRPRHSLTTTCTYTGGAWSRIANRILVNRDRGVAAGRHRSES